MAGRCVVETWAQFGFSGPFFTPKLKFVDGTNVICCTGGDEVHVFCSEERRLRTIIQFPGPVRDLVYSQDKQLLFAACCSGVYRVSSQYLLPRASGSPADASSCPDELKISSEFLVVPEEGVLSLLLVGSELLTLSCRDTSWVLTLHNSACSDRCEVLTSFSLPLVSALGDSDTYGKRRPVLVCVLPADTEPTSTDSHVVLEPLLFKLLFGVDAALLKSPVILCGLPDGRVCFLPLRLPGSRLRALHSLEQPVVFVGASVVVETDPGRSRCLVAMGELGRVVLIKTDKAGPEGGGITARFTESCVPGPVMCGHVDQNCLYYSTGSDLLALDLTQQSAEKPGLERDVEMSRSSALQSPTSLNVCRVLALAEPGCSTAGEVQLLGLSARGQLQRIVLPVRGEDGRLSQVPSTQVGRSVRDLLSSIWDVSERATMLKTAIKSKTQILRHLNPVVNISFLLINGTHSEEKPIRCRARTTWSRLLDKDSLNLTCVLENSSDYELERGWTLSIAVLPLSASGGESSSVNFSFPFQNLHPGDTLEVSLPLVAAGETSFPVTVSCSLQFLLSSLLGEEEANLLAPESNCISLPLNTLMVDWLHALQLIHPKKNTCHSSNTTGDTVQAFLSSHRMRCSGRGEGGGRGGGRGGGGGASKPEGEQQHSARVLLSSELLRDTLALKKSGSDPENVCLSLLEWLLSEGPGGVSAGHQGEKISGSVVHARSPDGHTVKLTAKQVETSMGKEETLATVEVQVESTSLAAVCGLHHAVLRRAQTLLQKAPERAATKTVQSLGLRQALQRAEHLLQQLQESRVSGAFSAGLSSGPMTRSLLSIYRDLRENPLLMI